MKFSVPAKFDVVIIGSGISGLLCAIELAKNGKTVFIGTKEAVTESSSLYAQGGMAVPLNESDSFDKHLQDTLKTGCGLSNIQSSKKIIEYSKIAFEKLVDFGVRFDLNKDQTIHQTQEAAHSFPRVVHVGGDASGRFITKVLIDNACREPNISISQGTVALKLIQNSDSSVSGVLFEDVAKHRYIVETQNVIVATGGAGYLYSNTTNPSVSTGDGIVMAYDAGAELRDLEMVQFHPTVCLSAKTPFLVTEAIRGEGARLKNVNGEYFGKKYHEDADLAPRDVLSRAILKELKETNSSCVYLDISNFTPEYFQSRFPTIYQMCIHNNIDLFNKGIPVAPAAHYFIGGIKVNECGQTNIKGLWSVGECASTGIHGANRLASNSLLECIVVPQFLVQKLLADTTNTRLEPSACQINNLDLNDRDISDLKDELRTRNLSVLGPVRNNLSLQTHKEWLKSLIQIYKPELLSSSYHIQEFKNMLVLSLLICESAINRKNSIGVHFRDDYPAFPDQIQHQIVQKTYSTPSLRCI